MPLVLESPRALCAPLLPFWDVARALWRGKARVFCENLAATLDADASAPHELLEARESEHLVAQGKAPLIAARGIDLMRSPATPIGLGCRRCTRSGLGCSSRPCRAWPRWWRPGGVGGVSEASTTWRPTAISRT